MNKSRKTAQESFYELVFRLCADEEQRHNVLPKLGDYFQLIFKKYEDIDYTLMYRMVSHSSLTYEDKDVILQILIEVESQVFQRDHKKMLTKMRRHFSLSHEQKANFDRLNDKFNSDLLKSEKALIKVQEDLVKANDYLEDIEIKTETLENESSKIYAQFVTILGIFTAIVISVFGGLSIVNGVFEKIDDTPMWKIVLTGSMVSILILCLLFLLTRWISTITNKAFGYESEKSLMETVTNNGAFAIGVSVFLYLIFAAVALSSLDVSIKIKEILSNWNVYVVLALFLLPFLGGGIILLGSSRLKNSEVKSNV